jgi:hypothetical protein
LLSAVRHFISELWLPCLGILKLQTGQPLGHQADTQFGTFASRDFAKLLNS